MLHSDCPRIPESAPDSRAAEQGEVRARLQSGGHSSSGVQVLLRPEESLGRPISDERRQQDQGARAPEQRARRHRDRCARWTLGSYHREGVDRRQAGTQLNSKSLDFASSP